MRQILVLLCLGVLLLFPLYAAAPGARFFSSSVKAAGTGTDSSAVGTVTWSSTSNITASDSSYALATRSMLGDSGQSHYLKATNFGFAIPSGATIDGITVRIQRARNPHADGMYIVDQVVKIIKSDSTLGSVNKADTSTHWPTSEAYATYGGAADLWSESWTDTNVNSSNFGVALSINYQDPLDDEFSLTGEVDYFEITVNYTAASGPSVQQKASGFFVLGS